MATRGRRPLSTDVTKFYPLKELTDQHKRFAKAYVLRGRNASKAAREAGFNPWYGHQLRLDPLMKAQIDAYAQILEKKFDLTEERIIAELVKVGFANLTDFIRVRDDGTPVLDFSDAGEDEISAISSIEQQQWTDWAGPDDEEGRKVKQTKIRFHPKLEALVTLCRIRGMFKEGAGETESPRERALKIKEALNALLKTDGLK